MFIMSGRLLAALAVAAIGSFCSGCGSDAYQTVPVRGTVMCNGQPAWGGTVVFYPLDAPEQTGRPKGNPGRPAAGMVQEDGSFTLMVRATTSNGEKVGALVGPHRVSFLPPQSTPATLSDEDRSLPPEEQEEIKATLAARPVFPQLSCGSTITPAEVEVKRGQDEFTFTLSK